MTWPEVLDRLETDALRLAAAAAGSPADVEAACAAALDASGVDLSALPAEHTPRALAVLQTLADAEAAVAHRIAAVQVALGSLRSGDEAPARFIDEDV